MNKQHLCKYLDAGAKSSPVILDPGLSTNNEQTLYLYHLNRDQIIEYKRDIVEAKLRDLSGDEQGLIEALEQAFQQARSSFVPRGAAAQSIPEKASAPAKSSSPRDEDGDDDGDEDIGLIGDDDLLDDDEEAEDED